MTCNKVINLESLRSKKRQDSSFTEKSSELKKFALQQTQVEGVQASSENFAQDILGEDGPRSMSVTPPVTKQSVSLATCAVDTEQFETKTQSSRPAPEVNEYPRPHVTVATSSDIGKYVC